MAVLIVEDNPVNAQLFAIILKSSGYQTVLARNGTEALTSLSGKEPIDLIITDFMMPEMNGFELIAKIREIPMFKNIPIMIASAQSDLETVTNAKALGCDCFLAKPIDKQLFLNRVTRLAKSDPPALRNKAYIMPKLGISAEEYASLATMLAAQLADTIPIAVLEQGDSEETISPNLGQLLKELGESAAILGAEKFHRIYTRFSGNRLPTRSQCTALLQVLQELEIALTTSTMSPPRTDVKN